MWGPATDRSAIPVAPTSAALLIGKVRDKVNAGDAHDETEGYVGENTVE